MALVFGLVVGSFLNVLIYRLPRGESIVRPGSHCPSCQAAIRFYDNIPVLSFLWLKGRCRACGATISRRYPLVEFISGLFALAAFLRFTPVWAALIYFAFCAALIVITFVDLDTQTIPFFIAVPGIPLGMLAAVVLPGITFIDSLWGVLLGGGILFAVGWIYKRISGIEGMGFGDVELLAMIGAFVGPRGVVVTILVSALLGSIIGLTVMAIQKRDLKYAIPYGPFLSIGAIAYLFWGDLIITSYSRMMQNLWR
ncbi:MAG: prepilin peptidase [Deltaproteobacteria bacterium]|nr:prepilin peptidase [Deltaproteobacteria bacterium]